MSGYIGSKAAVVSNGAERKKTYSITGTTTSLTGLSYTVNQVHVFHNGVRLVDGTDFTATNGNSITLTNTAQSGDEVVVISYAGYQVSDTVSASQGGTFSSSIDVNADGATVLTVDRASTDGTIIDVQKNGSSVGSIGVIASDILYVATPDGTGVGLNFDGDSPKINPSNGTGAGTDGVADLGNSSGRFKDLYLSGGVYLGGTGSANKLDDYEEGTWSPASGSGSNPLSVMGTGNRYTKIGRQVIAYFDITWNSGNSTASAANITGLPFTPSSNHEGDGAATIGYITGSAGVDFVAHVSNSNPSFNFYPDGSSGSANYSALAGRRIAGYVQYYTNA